jgi:hypothetical protein
MSVAKNTDIRSKLQLIQGGLRCDMSFGSIRIVAAPERSPPFEVDAVILEEDTWLIMSAEPKMGEPEEHPIRLMTELLEAQPKPVGSLIVQGKNPPLHFMAIVHDVNQDPTWREEWVASALKEVFREAERRKLEAVSLPLLATVHGKLVPQRFVELLSRTLLQTPITHLRRLWLIAPLTINAEIIDLLQKRLNNT